MYLSSICALAAALWSTATVAEPVQIRQASGCNAKNKQLIALNANLKDPVLFCMWWRGNTNNKTPFTSLKTSDANSVCKCINANPMLGGSTMVEVTPSNPQIKYLADFQNVILSPLPFCKVWTKSEGRDVAPFTEIAATVVSQLCSSIIKKPSLIAPKPNVTSTSTSAASRQTSSASASMMTSAMPSPTQLILNPLLRGSGSNSSGRNDLVLKTWSNIIGPVAHAQDLGHGTTPLHILSLLTTNENDVIYNSASVSTSYVVPATTTTAWWSASVVYDSWCNLSEGDNSEGCEGQVVVSGSDGNARTADLHITTGGVIEPTRSVNIPFDSSGRFSGGLSIGFKADTATLEEPIVYSIFGGMGGTPNHPRERYTATLLSTLGKRPRILELGCGAGIPITRMLLDQGTSVTANDISTEQLELAKERCPAATSLAGDMLAMDLPLGSFDGVVSFFAIFHLPRDEQRAMFDKIYDWLADGGAFTFNVATTDAAEIKSDFLGMVMFWSSFGTQENEAMIRDAGFRILQVEVLEAGDGKLAAEDPDHATTFQWVLAEKTERT